VEEAEARELVGRVEGLLAELESLPDPTARETARETVAALLDLYGEGLRRIVEESPASPTAIGSLADDELVSHLLFLHGLHPVSLEARVRGALEEVSPYLSSHGGGVELRGIEEGVVRVALEGSCSGCPSSTATLKLAIEDAIQRAAPEIERVEAEGEQAASSGNGNLIQLAPPGGGEPAAEAGGAEWASAGAMSQLPGGEPRCKQVGGEEILFLRLAGELYAYRPACPGCETSLEEAGLEGTALVCAGCGNRYDVLRAGRCLDHPQLHLEPVPLLSDEDGQVRIALPAPA
jgi:Fe-S cluster biogenesis protein NfuA/nitrite reductase/ring-hydroxylating ferredoxin subunit